jgi:hypothetical protein
MPTLPTDLRSQLEKVIIKAREISEIAAKSALEALAVQHHEPYKHMTPDQRELRNKLRARARQHGDRRLPKPDSSGNDHEISHLISECAYEHWHRMLFARFLAENGLLIEAEESVAISLAEARELAKGEGLDVWVYASRCAQRMLPQIFRPDDPLLQVAFAPEHILKLETLLDSIPTQVFTASDSLGWVYQFWQTKKKKEINDSEVKIGADEISAVTQLFTEPYMVEFLIHNTLGAWWAGKRLTSHDREKAASEDELRKRLALPGVNWNYLRFVRGEDGKGGPWRPAAGTFDGWPKAANEIKVMDPCCGSGHFLVAAMHHLVPMRMTEEGLSAAEAVDAVLRDNLHGLEIDERCCQIAAFALAFAAWTYPDASGYRTLPELNIACTGIAPQATKEQWLQLAEKAAAKGRMPAKRDLFGKQDSLLSSTLANALEALYDMFAQAPILGSLIDPRRISRNLYQASYESLAPLLIEVFKAEGDHETRERAIAAAGMVKAADLLVGEYTLVITNVPYLGRNRQHEMLKARLENHFKDGKADLATAFVERCINYCSQYGMAALVTPHNWLFLTTYKQLRESFLKAREWNLVARLGPGAFDGIGGHVVNVALLVLGASRPSRAKVIAGIEVSAASLPKDKAQRLRGCDGGKIILVSQADQLKNPDAAIDFTGSTGKTRLLKYASAVQGIGTGDLPRYLRCFWELREVDLDWQYFQTTPEHSGFSGYTGIIHWERGLGPLAQIGTARKGLQIVGKAGIAVAVTSSLEWAYFLGTRFDCTIGVLIPHDPVNLPAIAALTSDPDFASRVRGVDQALSVTEANFLKVPFDLTHWQKVAEKKYPDGLPEPESDDPTQWLFHGRPDEAQEGTELQVAVARMLGYRWPAELDEKMRLSRRARKLAKSCDDLLEYADKDGIVCIPSVRGEEPAAERLLRLLAACGIKPGNDLDDWLRNSFFEEHCKLFHDRPFIWHIWDGRKRDGFHALVNYHKLAESNGKGRRLLENLTHSYLNDWISRQKDGVKRGVEGAEDRLAAALELKKRLEAILEGEPPFDIFVRWKPLNQQSIGWEPDINDGVRMNIRPFMASDLPNGKKGSGILRIKPNIKWEKDRGKEPHRPKADYPWFWKGNEFTGDRVNDVHLTNEEKRKARDKK